MALHSSSQKIENMDYRRKFIFNSDLNFMRVTHFGCAYLKRKWPNTDFFSIKPALLGNTENIRPTGIWISLGLRLYLTIHPSCCHNTDTNIVVSKQEKFLHRTQAYGKNRHAKLM